MVACLFLAAAAVVADYAVEVDGRSVEVVRCLQSGMPFNRGWPGYQRSVDQAERAAYASFEAAGPVDVSVMLPEGVEGISPTVRPLSRDVKTVKSGRRVSFRLPGPGQYVFEPEGTRHHALQLFVNPPERKPKWKWTREFGPGEHFPGLIMLRKGDRVYIHPNAVVHGGFGADGVSDVKIFGTGRVVSDVFERHIVTNTWKAMAASIGSCNFAALNSSDIEVRGVVFENAAMWSVATFDCDRVLFDGIKVVGQWRYNTDGVDVCNSRDVTIQNSFVHSFDDTITVKGLYPLKDRPVERVLSTNCVLWCDWGRTCEVGIETWASRYRGVSFVDCDCIHNSASVLDVQAGGDGKVEDIVFRNIRVEYERFIEPEVFQADDEDKYDPGARDGNPYLYYIDNHKFGQHFMERYSEISGVSITGITVYLAPGRQQPPTWIKSVDPKRPLGQYGCELLMGCANPGGERARFENIEIEVPVFVTREQGLPGMIPGNSRRSTVADKVTFWGYVLDKTPTACPFVFGKTDVSLERAAEEFGACRVMYMNSCFNKEYLDRNFDYWDPECIENCVKNRLKDVQLEKLRGMKEVWCATTNGKKLESALAIAKMSLKYPNIVGVVFDDFLVDDNPELGMSVEKLRDLKAAMCAINPKLKVSAVSYVKDSKGLNVDLSPYRGLIDHVSRWKWEAETNHWHNIRADIAELRRQVGPTATIVHGLYMHDFAKSLKSVDPLPINYFKFSVSAALDAVADGTIDGIVLPQVGWYSNPSHRAHYEWLRQKIREFDRRKSP